ncbi:recombinase family protein [Streptomyces sp. NPDC058316]|uniref:recombinase family protein n=1 Tax=Streptomyces sp. NPDC058316 TaxID=3346442 RepID=UPI0036E85967
MANLVYKRVSTDQQSTARQDLVLDEARIEDPVVFEEDPGTSSRLHPLQRPKFRELLTYAPPGDTVHTSEMFRLVRGTGHSLDVLGSAADSVKPVIYDSSSAKFRNPLERVTFTIPDWRSAAFRY